MAAEKRYRQCELQRGSKVTTAWIDVRAAAVGARVELKGDTGGLWRVMHAYDHTMSEAALNEHQQLNRNSLPSVEGMR